MDASADRRSSRPRIALLGAGKLGEALLGGLLRSGWAQPGQLHCTVRRQDHAVALAARHGVTVTTDSRAAVADADVVILAVKPQSMRDLLIEVTDAVQPDQTIVSLAAGVTTAAIEALLPGDVAVVRVMSNVPVQVDEAMSVVTPGAHAGEAHLATARAIVGHVGRVVDLPEVHLDAVTALSGSGPAYFALVAEAMIDAGILLGLSRDVATELVTQTMVGTAKLLRDSGRHPVELRESVTSPGGTTIAAVRVLEEQRVRAAFLNAIEAAQQRATALAGD